MTDEALRRACYELYRALDYDAAKSVDAILAFAKQQRAAGLLEGAKVVNGLMGKDSGNWNRAIIYAEDAIKQRAKELEHE